MEQSSIPAIVYWGSGKSRKESDFLFLCRAVVGRAEKIYTMYKKEKEQMFPRGSFHPNHMIKCWEMEGGSL